MLIIGKKLHILSTEVRSKSNGNRKKKIFDL